MTDLLSPVGSPGWVTAIAASRPGRRKFGVPPGGPYDPVSAAVAARMAGHERFRSGYEVLLLPAEFYAVRDVWVGVAGAAGTVEAAGETFSTPWGGAIGAGETFNVGAPQAGCRTYVVAGPGPSIPDSASAALPIAVEGVRLRVWPGPQADLFDFEAFCSLEFSVSRLADRVGIRLEGAFVPGGAELPSEPACAGTVQVTPSGQPIVLGPDGPTIGGYPKIAVVASEDLPWLGQLVPGQGVAFAPFGQVVTPPGR